MDTRTQLLIAAEKIYALYGIQEATSRRILAEANQRNSSALSYHFSTRLDLMEAICKLRMEPINSTRNEMIDDFLSNPPATPERLHSLVRIAFVPSIAPIIDAKGTSYFRRFFAQAIANPSIGLSLHRGKFDSGLRQTSVLIRREIDNIPAAIASHRIDTMYRSLGYLTAHLEARCAIGAWKDRKLELQTEIDLLIDGFTGFLQAQHTATVPEKAISSMIDRTGSRLEHVLL